MLAWSEGTDNGRQKTRNHDCRGVIVGKELLLITPITLANLSAKPDSNRHERRTLHGFFPVGGMPTAKQLGLKGLPKSQDAVRAAD